MSSLIVDVCTVEERIPHPNADRVELIRVKNWWVVSQIGQFVVGDKVVYFPPDSVITEELAESFGISKYVAPLAKGADGLRPPGARIKAQRFRGQSSFGFICTPDDPSWEVGTSVIDHYGVTKYEPPIRIGDGDSAPPVAAFHNYTDIENIGNFPGVFIDGEEIVADEKIHGANCRIGKILAANPETGIAEFQYMGGSRTTRRREFDVNKNRSKYWQAMIPETIALLDHLCEYDPDMHGSGHNVMLFGELYGAGIQDMAYALTNTQHVRFYDIAVDGNYLDYDEKMKLFGYFNVEVVPFIYRGPFSLEQVLSLTDGPTEVCNPAKIQAKFKGREGIVIRPVRERYCPLLPNSGRVILKSISADYIDRKGGADLGES